MRLVAVAELGGWAAQRLGGAGRRDGLVRRAGPGAGDAPALARVPGLRGRDPAGGCILSYGGSSVRGMTSRLNPYINFDGDARAALEFYRSVFGGELTLSSFGDFGTADPAVADRIMHGQLETPAGYTLMGSDIMPGMPFSPGTTMTVSLSGDDADALHDYWTKLSDGATVTMTLEKQVWGDEFGQLTDRFGVPWMINIGQPQG